MLDPIEQAKGGFGAQIARAETPHAHRADEVGADEAGAASSDAPPTESQADGERGPAPRPQLKPALPAPPARQPKRWR